MSAEQPSMNPQATVEDVFERARRLIESAPESNYRIEYDREWGFPIVVDFDNPDWEDEQWRLVADGFKPRHR
jgi:hypothetical protein